MSMKKKFLALALAGAVALPMTANATTSIEMGKNETKDTSVTVTGTVSNENGQAPAGRIQVEIPSAVTFSIDQDGNFTAPKNFTINNRGQEAIKLEVIDFLESKPETDDTGIKLYQYSNFSGASKKRNEIALKLIGSDNNTHAADLSQVKGGNSTVLFERIEGNTAKTLQLDGQVGDTTTGTANGASEDFTLKLRISKAN